MTTTFNEGFPEDFVVAGGPGDWHTYDSGTVSLRGLGARMGDVHIVCMGPGLAADLKQAGHTNPGRLAAAATKIASTATDTAKPGEPAGFLYKADTALGEVWIELFGPNEASMFYPKER